jgi:hypothetical protein
MKYYVNKDYLTRGQNYFTRTDGGRYVMATDGEEWYYVRENNDLETSQLGFGAFADCVLKGAWVEISNPYPRKIIAGVAILGDKRGQENPKVYFVSSPGRHHTLIKIMADMFKLPTPIGGEQGFITDTGEYVDRVEAKKLAIKYGQLLDPEVRKSDKKLYSEDLW